ncbi:hypothetical protein [Streptomyces sp. NPDC085665]|uniref:hypothetical protein n=1 Tax=Streptomyces sp. NPDC085665 TaxID=3365735 RepID=UPI0037D5C4CD
MSKSDKLSSPGPMGFSVFGEALSSGYCDAAVQYQLGRVLMNSAFSNFSSPNLGEVVDNDDRLVEVFLLVDTCWSQVRASWARLRNAGDHRAQQRSDSREGRKVRRVGKEDPDSQAEFAAAKRSFSSALGDLADAYQQCQA